MIFWDFVIFFAQIPITESCQCEQITCVVLHEFPSSLTDFLLLGVNIFSPVFAQRVSSHESCSVPECPQWCGRIMIQGRVSFFSLCLSIKMIKPKPSVCPLPLIFCNDFQSFKDTKYVAKIVFYPDESSR